MEWLSLREPVNSWTHGAWMLCALPAILVLWRRCRENRVKQYSLVFFGLTLVLCFAGSAVYHGVRVSPEEVEVFATIDYIGIFLLIGGSITPVAMIVLHGAWRWATMVITWSVCGGGIFLNLVCHTVPRTLSTALYIALGWGVLLCYFQLARALTHRALRSVWVGGLFYTAGAILNLLNWPRLWPGFFGSHEIHHLCVMAGSLCHYWFMLTAIVPYRRAAEAVRQATARRPAAARPAAVPIE
jgi:hemolysin III